MTGWPLDREPDVCGSGTRLEDWDVIGDAEYIAVTLLQADALIALDESLARTANGIVALASPDALASAPGA